MKCNACKGSGCYGEDLHIQEVPWPRCPVCNGSGKYFNTHEYRLLKSTWGIAINIEAHIDRWSRKNVLEVMPEVKLTTSEMEWLKKGKSYCPYCEVVISKIEYNPTDYQEEGLAAALIHIVHESFHLPIPNINVEFDKEKRRYVYEW